MSDQKFDWKRYWYPHGTEAPLFRGYLIDPEFTDSRYGNAGVTLAELSSVPCLVLLGAPGFGKSNEMEQAASERRAAGEIVDLIQLGRTFDPLNEVDALVKSNNAKIWTQGDAIWNVFIDGLDEALPQSPELVRRLPEIFQRLATDAQTLSNLRVRLSCRSAEWPDKLGDALRGIWERRDIGVYELAPLREVDARSAAQIVTSSEESARTFLKQVEEQEAEPLASRPVTLKMLLNIFKKSTELPSQQVHLYRRALLSLIEENNEFRRARYNIKQLDIHSKLIVAGRIAAASAFSNSPILWTGLQSEPGPENAVSISDIAGGYEPALGSSFFVSETELLEVLRTALFTPVGPTAYVWSHQTFLEFLAAYYLVEHGLSDAELYSFLTGNHLSPGEGPTSDDLKIPPQLREIAAWLSSMQPAFFRRLVGLEPDILLRSDIGAAEPTDREALVDELLQKFDHEELHDRSDSVRLRFERLTHPRLLAQVRPYIRDRERGIIARRAAIEIAEANDLRDLSDDLVEVALNESDEIHIREVAARSLARLGSPEARARLRPLALHGSPNDRTDELKGAALRATWPEILSFSELLSALRPPRDPNFIGSYYFFLYDLQFPELSPDDAISATTWIRSRLASRQEVEERDFSLRTLLPRLLRRVWEQASDRTVRDALADLLIDEMRELRLLLVGEMETNIRDIFAGDPNRRREVLMTALARSEDQLETARHISFTAPLVDDGDLPFLIDELSNSESSVSKPALIEMIVLAARRRDIAELEFVWDAARNVPELESALTQAFSIDLASAAAKWAREDYSRKQQIQLEQAEKQAKRRSAPDRVEDFLKVIESGDISRWWELNLQLFVDEDGHYQSKYEFQGDLRATPGWQLISCDQQARVISTAADYINSGSLDSLTWLGTHTHHRPAAAGFRAFRLLYSEANEAYRAISNDSWAKWAPALLGFSANDSREDADARRVIIGDLFNHAKGAALQVLDTLLSPSSTFSLRQLLPDIDASYDEDLANTLLKVLSRGNEDEIERIRTIIQFLIERNHPALTELALDCLRQAGPITGSWLNTESKVTVATTALLLTRPATAFPLVQGLTEKNESFSRLVWTSFADAWEYSDRSFFEGLSEAQVGELFLILYRLFPPRQETSRTRVMTTRDFIAGLRSALLNNLVKRATADAIDSLGRISSTLPDAKWLRWQLGEAKTALRAKNWKTLAPRAVIEAITSYQPLPPIRSEAAMLKASLDQQEMDDSAANVLVPTGLNLEVQPDGPTKAAKAVRLRILAVATEWNSGHGGVSTVNRDLCISLAELGHEIVCLVLEATQQEEHDASARNVQVIRAPTRVSIEGVNRLLLFHQDNIPDFKPDIVIGHDHITGSQAAHIAKVTYKCPYVHLVHTLPEEIEPYKTRVEGEGFKFLRGNAKETAQITICREADLIVTIGPRIFRHFETRVGSSKPVIEICPGLDPVLLGTNVNLSKLLALNCVFFGRMEDADLKGAKLACEMIRKVVQDGNWTAPWARPKLVMRGFDEVNIDREIASIGGIEPYKDYLSLRSYTSVAQKIIDDILTASVIIMPSKREGFGLVALEAIAAGVPVVISNQSGIGEMLWREHEAGRIPQATVDLCLADVDGDPPQIASLWADKVRSILADRESAFERAEKLRNTLRTTLTWQSAARRLVDEVARILTPQSTETKPVG